jgi:UPF0042 nucleotide-binding protein
MRIVLITGISGSGKSVALNVLEDAGYYCVDNLPPALLPSLVETINGADSKCVAVAVDARSAESLAELPSTVRALREHGHDVKVMYLTASTHSLVARFSETRRSHPLSHELRPGENPASRRTLIECISEERERLGSIEKLGHVIDTSEMSANKLRAWVKELAEVEYAKLTLYFESFAFKRGVPLDADFVFDVRAVPNPYYDLTLRPLTGARHRLPRRPAPGHRDAGRHPRLRRQVAALLQDRQPQLPDGGGRLHGRPAPLGLHGRTPGRLFWRDRTGGCAASRAALRLIRAPSRKTPQSQRTPPGS